MADTPSKFTDAPKVELGATADRIARSYPDVWKAYQQLGEAIGAAGPLGARTRRLVHLAYAMAAESPGAVHSHVRRGLAEGISPDEMAQTAVLSATTLGWPKAVHSLILVADITDGSASAGRDVAAEISECVGF